MFNIFIFLIDLSCFLNLVMINGMIDKKKRKDSLWKWWWFHIFQPNTSFRKNFFTNPNFSFFPWLSLQKKRKKNRINQKRKQKISLIFHSFLIRFGHEHFVFVHCPTSSYLLYLCSEISFLVMEKQAKQKSWERQIYPFFFLFFRWAAKS